MRRRAAALAAFMVGPWVDLVWAAGAVPPPPTAFLKASDAAATYMTSAPASALVAAWAYTDAQARAAAPVQSVNTATGSVTVPTYQSQVSGPLVPSSTTGLVTFTFSPPFANPPTCWHELSSTVTASYSYDDPVVAAKSLTAVTFRVTAHPVALSLVTPPLLVFAPAGTSITIRCFAPM